MPNLITLSPTSDGIANYLLDRNWAAKKDWNTALELAEQTGNKRLKAQTEKLLKRVN